MVNALASGNGRGWLSQCKQCTHGHTRRNAKTHAPQLAPGAAGCSRANWNEHKTFPRLRRQWTRTLASLLDVGTLSRGVHEGQPQPWLRCGRGARSPRRTPKIVFTTFTRGTDTLGPNVIAYALRRMHIGCWQTDRGIFWFCLCLPRNHIARQNKSRSSIDLNNNIFIYLPDVTPKVTHFLKILHHITNTITN